MPTSSTTWKDYTKNDKRVTNDPMEAHCIGFNMWVKAVEKAGTTDPDAVIDAIVGVSVPNLSGGSSTMMPNHHITKPVLIGEIQADGQFETVWQTSGLVVGDEWSDYLPDSKDLIADWRAPLVLRQLQCRHRQMRWQGHQLSRAHRGMTASGRAVSSARPEASTSILPS